MQNKTTYVSKEIFLNELINTVNDFKKTFIKSDRIFNSDFYVTDKETYHFIVKLLKANISDNEIRKMISNVFYSDIYKGEILSANTSFVYMTFIYSFMDYVVERDLFHVINQQNIDILLENALKKLKSLIENSYKPISEAQINIVIENTCRMNKTLASACKEAIKLSGLEGKIVIENSKQKNYTIELKEGYSFNLTPYKFFIDNNIWERKECKVLVVDGFIENVSEIDQILIKANEYKQSIVFIAQGFSEEVIATLYTNKKKGLLDIMPLRLKSDINNLNIINDISVVCGKDPISSLKGEMLTYVKYEDLATVEKITVTEHKTSIENSSTYKNVLAQIKMLINKRYDNQDLEDVQILIENRIKNLSPNAVVMYLPEMSSTNNDTIRVTIDDTLRKIKTLINYGFVDEYMIINELLWNKISLIHIIVDNEKIPIAENDFENCFFKIIDDYHRKEQFDHGFISNLSYYLGIMLATKTIITLLNCSGCVKSSK